jgi:protocatechuate 3,4-dioxygenase beta subunit
MSTPLGTITGRVVGPAGAPVAGATVAIAAGSQPHNDIAAVTAADGTFRLGGVRPGEYRLEAHADRATQSADVKVAAGAQAHVEIRLP